MYIVLEMQTNGGATSIAPAQSFASKNQADAAYHQILAAAAVSNVEKHTLGAAKKHSSAEHAKTMETIYLKAIRNKNSERKNDIYKNRRHRRRMANK